MAYRSMVVEMVPVKGGIGSFFTPQKDYKWYISGIYCQLGDYMPPTAFYGNHKQPLINIFFQLLQNTVDGRNPKQPPEIGKTL